MKSLPLVSVIIVNYNAGKLLIDSVQSVINFPGVEVLVADNASKDNSFINLAKKVKKNNLILIDNHANLGFGKAVNGAVQKSHGRYLYLLNPDASLSKSALSRMVTTAQKYNDKAIIAPRLENPDGTAQPSCYRPQTLWNAIKEYWLGIKGSYSKYLPSGQAPQRVYAAVAAAWLVSRKTWDELGGLSDRFFLYFEDIDLCDRANRANIPIIYDPQAIVKHHHGISSTTNPVVMTLYYNSALEYNGRFKQWAINTVVHLRDFFVPPVSTKKLFGIIVAYTALVLVVASLGYLLLPSRLSPLPFLPNWTKDNFLFWSWANFDGEHYLRIARDGYRTIAGQSEYAFFPLFPLLINLISRLGLNTYLAAHLLTLTSSIGLIFGLVKWASDKLKNPLTLLWFFLLSPGAIFLSALYTEPLFLFLTIMTFLFAEKKEWGRAALFTALATATRINGIFVVLFLFIKMLKGKQRVASLIQHLLVALSGLFTYMIYLFVKTGNPLTFYSAQAGWAKSTVTPPWMTLSNYFRTLTTEFVPDLVHLTVIIEVLVTAIMIYLFIKLLQSKKTDLAYKWYLGGNLALPLATGSLGSMPRFALTMFPLLLIVPKLPRRTQIFLITIFSLCFTLGTILFIRGYWYA